MQSTNGAFSFTGDSRGTYLQTATDYWVCTNGANGDNPLASFENTYVGVGGDLKGGLPNIALNVDGNITNNVPHGQQPLMDKLAELCKFWWQ